MSKRKRTEPPRSRVRRPTKASAALLAYIEASDDAQRARAAVATYAGVGIDAVRRWAWGDSVPRDREKKKLEFITGGAVRAVDWFVSVAAAAA